MCGCAKAKMLLPPHGVFMTLPWCLSEFAVNQFGEQHQKKTNHTKQANSLLPAQLLKQLSKPDLLQGRRVPRAVSASVSV